jgi:sec-independent protein translocase protein TatA
LFGLGFQELLVILVIIMIVFGVGKLPQIGEGMGKAIRGFKKGMDSPDDDDDDDKRDGGDQSKLKD